ncbi:hypothetical protein C2G38_2233774 [Gigaspora rosea]|uniref:Uncharacterized protein n=1 Tax=Gigaspora rosea TaxID=44941 RepID=A0A397TQX0_9GLOM|nr:hypothetical protein C2G38_2233774 [Gigaspora rosea]
MSRVLLWRPYSSASTLSCRLDILVNLNFIAEFTLWRFRRSGIPLDIDLTVHSVFLLESFVRVVVQFLLIAELACRVFISIAGLGLKSCYSGGAGFDFFVLGGLVLGSPTILVWVLALEVALGWSQSTSLVGGLVDKGFQDRIGSWKRSVDNSGLLAILPKRRLGSIITLRLLNAVTEDKVLESVWKIGFEVKIWGY